MIISSTIYDVDQSLKNVIIFFLLVSKPFYLFFLISVPLDYFKACLTTKKDGKKLVNQLLCKIAFPLKKININLNPKYLKRKMSQTNVKWPFGAYVKKIDLIWIFFVLN